jgi:regulatory protein
VNEGRRDGRPQRSRPKVNALQYAVRLLSTRAYSENKLREKLALRQFTPEEIAAAVARLKAERLLDDRRFMEDFIRARLASRPRTGAALVRDLILRGIPRKLAQEAVQELSPPEDELPLAVEVVRRKLSVYVSLDEPTRRRRLASLLARRGFSYATIQKVLRLDPDQLPTDEE